MPHASRVCTQAAHWADSQGVSKMFMLGFQAAVALNNNAGVDKIGVRKTKNRTCIRYEVVESTVENS